MVSLFKDRSPATIFWLLILSIIVHSHFLVATPVVETAPANGLLSYLLRSYLQRLNPILLLFIYHAVVILQALRLNYLFTDFRMYTRANFLPAMVYILLSGVFVEWSYLSPALFANAMVIWLFAKVVRLYNSPDPKTLLFNMGLVIGTTVLFYYPAALLVPVAMFALFALRPFNITELLVLFMGVLLPYYFLCAYLFLTDRFGTITTFLPRWALNMPDISSLIPFFITFGILMLILVIGLFYWRHENRRLLIQVRKNWTVLLVMLLFLGAAPFLNENEGLSSFMLLIVPASPFIAKGFIAPQKGFLPWLMFWILLGLALVNNWQLLQHFGLKV